MSGEGTAVTAVTFDYWNTLCCEPPGGYLRGHRLEAIAQVLVDAGVGSAGVVLPVLTAGYDAAWGHWNDGWRANRQFTGNDAAHAICAAVEEAFADSLAVAALRPRICAAFAGQGEGADLHLVDGVADTLAALSGRGVRLGIICDVHVGDRRRTDVAGAQSAGMRAVRITTVFEDLEEGPTGDVVISSYDQLLPALGLAS